MIKKFKDRSGNIITKNDGQETLLNLLYGSLPGRAVLKLLTAPAVSEIAGGFAAVPRRGL